jgi:hypothetical protein
VADNLPAGQKQLAALQKKNSTLLGRFFMLVALVFVGCLGGGVYLHHKHGSLGAESTEILTSPAEELAALSNNHAYELMVMGDSYVEWLSLRGVPFESSLLSFVIDVVAASSLELDIFPENSDSGGMYGLLFSAFIRLCFLIIACWRVWLFALIVSALMTIVKYRPYEGDDYLGQSGIGRVFYSGVYAGLNKMTKNGEIDTFMTGLACPFTVTRAEADQSELVAFLKSVGAYNETNVALAAVILAYPSLPAYVVAAEHADGLRKFMNVGELPAATLQILKRAFDLYQRYHQDMYEVPEDVLSFRHSQKREDLGFEPARQEPLSLDEYGLYLGSALCRVLDLQMAHDLRRVDAAELATVLLSAQAGRSIVHIKVGYQWLPRSTMPQLSARAVLHAVAAFPREYDYESRMRVRRALIYAWRKSAFGPVTFPRDLTNRTQALRQWTEVLFSMPHDLLGNSLEVELFGLSWRSHKKFLSRFYEWTASLSPDNREHGVFVTHAELLFAPARHLIRIWNEVVEPGTTERIVALVALVSERQRLKEAQQSSPTADPEASALPRYEKILPPMDDEEQTRLCELHQLSRQEMRAWDGIRVVLNGYSWMGRRVGHMAVPGSSLVCTAFKTEELLPDRNSIGLVGRRGLVPLRSSRLLEHWGRSWKERFIFGDTETIARSEEEYQKLLAGKRVVEAEPVVPADTGTPPSSSLA